MSLLHGYQYIQMTCSVVLKKLDQQRALRQRIAVFFFRKIEIFDFVEKPKNSVGRMMRYVHALENSSRK